VFINNHQPVEPLGPVSGVQFDVQLDQDQIVFPPDPVEIPAGAILALPVAITVAGVELRWGTVNLITLLEADEPVLVAHAHPGLDPQVAVPAGYRVIGADARKIGKDLVTTLVPGPDPVSLESPQGARLHLLVLDSAQALHAWTAASHGQRRLVLSAADIIERDDSVLALVESDSTVAILDAATRTWTEQVLSAVASAPVSLQLRRAEPPGRPTPRSFGGRASAPTWAEVAEFSARYRLSVDAIPAHIERAVLVIDLVGDVAELTIDGHDEPFDDMFWNGEPWTVDLTRFAGAGPLALEIRLTSFHPDASIWLTPAARAKRDNGAGAVVHAAELRLTRAVTIA
jgi:hypothetical protein